MNFCDDTVFESQSDALRLNPSVEVAEMTSVVVVVAVVDGGSCESVCDGGGRLTGTASPSCPPEYERPHANAKVWAPAVRVHWLWVGHTGREGQVPIIAQGDRQGFARHEGSLCCSHCFVVLMVK
jgi:hypothetical protein